MAACCGVPPYTPDQLMEIVVTDTTVSTRVGTALARPRRLSPSEGFALAASARALLAVAGQRRGAAPCPGRWPSSTGPSAARRSRWSSTRPPSSPWCGRRSTRRAPGHLLLLGLDRPGDRPGDRAPCGCSPPTATGTSTPGAARPAICGGSGSTGSARPRWSTADGPGRPTGTARMRPGGAGHAGQPAPTRVHRASNPSCPVRTAAGSGSPSTRRPPGWSSPSPSAGRTGVGRRRVELELSSAATPGWSAFSSGSGPTSGWSTRRSTGSLAAEAAARILLRYDEQRGIMKDT